MTGRPLSLLDNIRISSGPEILRSYFSELLHTNRNNLAELLSDRHLRFSTLYMLKSDIKGSGLRDSLPAVYKQALELSEALSEAETADTAPSRRRSSTFGRYAGTRLSGRNRAGKKAKPVDEMLADPSSAQALGWIVRTGWDGDMPEEHYERLMERCTALLLVLLKDRSVLPDVADVIFERHRQGKLVHNLVWAFFEAHDRESLYLIAQRLCSPDRRDAALARKLLCFIPGTDDVSADGHSQYFSVLEWLAVNMPYIHFTGESMQMCPKPVFCAVSHEGRYLCTQVSADSGKPEIPSGGPEAERLERFRRLDGSQKRLLADVSCALFMQDKRRWESWIRLPLGEQLESALSMLGGSG